MNLQDEDNTDPFVELDDAHEYVGGISEFARLQEEREALISQGVPPDMLDKPMDPSAVAGDEHQSETTHTFSGGAILKVQETRKDTNPKDGAGSLKPSYSAVPVPVLYELGAALTEGARKYGGYNWRVAGVRSSVYIDATRRHLDAFWEGEDIDPDSGLSHITKAIASLTVFRDAMIQGKVENDDRPPRTEAPFMAEGLERMADLQRRYPKQVPNYTEEQVAHTRNTPVSTYGGQTLGFDIEVMLPADGSPEGFVWAQQGDRRMDLDQALAVAQALRDDGYGERVVRVMRAMQKVEQMADSTEYIVGEMREPLTTVFPGDPSLMELTEDEAAELEVEEDPDAGLDEDGGV